MHTHTHPFNGPLSGTTRVSQYQKGKTNQDFSEARDSGWQWHRLDHMQVCTSLQTDNHANTSLLSFLQAGCPSCRPTNSVKALKAKVTNLTHLLNNIKLKSYVKTLLTNIINNKKDTVVLQAHMAHLINKIYVKQVRTTIKQNLVYLHLFCASNMCKKNKTVITKHLRNQHIKASFNSPNFNTTSCVSSRSGVATLRTAIHLLLTYLLTLPSLAEHNATKLQ